MPLCHGILWMYIDNCIGCGFQQSCQYELKKIRFEQTLLNTVNDYGGDPKMEYEPIEPNVWKPLKKGDSVEGKLVSKKENVGPNESKTYYIESNGVQVMVWGTTVLDSRMDFVEVGENIKIIYEGNLPNKKGQPTKIFVVMREKKLPERVTVEEVISS